MAELLKLDQIFSNSVGRLRSGWRFLICLAAYVAVTLALGLVIGAASKLTGVNINNTLGGFLLVQLLATTAFSAAAWLCGRHLEGLPFRAVGWSPRDLWWRDLLLGSGLGVATLAIAALIAALGGGLQLVPNATATGGAIVQSLLITVPIFVLAAASEEILLRGYPLQTFVRARFAWLGILLTSTLFSLAHLGNPNVAPFFTFVNTLLAGIWFAVAYLKSRNLWFALGLHWAWNWAMISIFGLPVSGITSFGGFRPEPLLRGVDTGPTWLTGGHYGLEGGAACTVAIILSTVAVWLLPFPKPTPEMLALTERENPLPEQAANHEVLSLRGSGG